MNYTRKSIDALRRLIPATRSGLGDLLVAVLIAFLMFLIGLSLSLPEESLRARLQYELERELPARVLIGQVGFTLPFSLAAKNVTVRFSEPGLPELKLDTIRLTPRLATLIGKPGASYQARLGQGRIGGTITNSGAFSFEADRLDFDEPIQGFAQLRLSGQIRATELNSHLQPAPAKPSTLTLQAVGLRISGTGSVGLPIDQLNLGQLDLVLTGVGNTFTLNRAELSAGDLRVTASGQIILGRTPAATRLNLELQLQPAAGLDPAVGSLLELVGSTGADGQRKLTLRGSLARPVIR